QGEHPLRPYSTTRGEVILLAGVLEDAHVRRWLDDVKRLEQTSRRDGEADPGGRVTLTCTGKDLGQAPTVGVRWGTDHGFDTMEDIRVGQVKDCSVRHGD